MAKVEEDKCKFDEIDIDQTKKIIVQSVDVIFTCLNDFIVKKKIPDDIDVGMRCRVLRGMWLTLFDDLEKELRYRLRRASNENISKSDNEEVTGIEDYFFKKTLNSFKETAIK